MKLCFSHENIGTFFNLCPNFDCPLLLYFKKYFSLKCPKWYILRYQFIKWDKNAKIMTSIFNGCHTNLEFFTVCMVMAFMEAGAIFRHAYMTFFALHTYSEKRYYKSYIPAAFVEKCDQKADKILPFQKKSIFHQRSMCKNTFSRVGRMVRILTK